MTGGTSVVAHDSSSPAGVCGAQKRQGVGECARPAGWGTDHVGQGRCKLHGGSNPLKHGRYSTIQRPRIRALIEEHEADPNPLNTLPELAAARALFQDWVDRYEEHTDALLAWHASWRLRNAISPDHADALRRVIDAREADVAEEFADDEDGIPEGVRDDLVKARETVDALTAGDDAKPRRVLDLADAVGHTEAITRIVERIEKVRAGNHVTYEQLRRFLFALDRVLDVRVPDARVRERIRADILAVQVA
jgi:hypothetical protein